MTLVRRLINRAALVATALVAPAVLQAQALNYPALQVPTVSDRDYTAALVGSAGTMLLFQWRESLGSDLHGSLDLGLYDPNNRAGNTTFFIGGNLGKSLASASAQQPLDLLLTAGAGLSAGGGRTGFRLPVGVSMGHTFLLEEGMAITPFVHPRVSIDLCSSCSPRGRSETDVSLNFDVGASFDFNRQLSARVSALFSGTNQFGGGDAIAIGLTWTPDGLRR